MSEEIITKLDTEREDTKDKKERITKTVSGMSSTLSAAESTSQAAVTFSKPDSYTGNRNLYDSGMAKKAAKDAAFNSGKKVYDPYTGKELVKTKAEAKQRFGKEWQDHLAESDHVNPLENIHAENKKNPWVTNDDIKEAANSEANIKVTSRKYNNAKRKKTNEEFVNDKEYVKDKNVKITKKGREQALKDQAASETAIKKKMLTDTVKNVAKTGHAAGIASAQNAGVSTLTVSSIQNIVAVINGEKTAYDAVADVAKDSGTAVASGYAMGGGLTVLSHTLSNSSSQFIKSLVDNNVPGKVITAVIATGGVLKRYAGGEISTQECLWQLGESGVNVVSTGYFMGIGQALIPIPIVGAAIGGMVGGILTSSYIASLREGLSISNKYEHEERMRRIAECEKAVEELKAYRAEMEKYLEAYFKDYQSCFDEALNLMKLSFEEGDTDGIISGANSITEKLGGKVKYRNIEEFKVFLSDETVDVI